MSRRTRGESLAPSMFPFLAVLLCTMGALVLILMLIVASAQASTSEAKQEQAEKRELLESQLEVLDRSAKNRLYEGRIALEKERLRLQHYEEHIAEIEDELADLQKTLDALESQKDEETEQQQLAKMTELEKQIAEAAEKLKNKELEKPEEGDKPIFAIIPYDGPNGTHRRPIYLECDAEGVLIQPEGVRLSIEDIKPPYGPGNPLDAALRTIRAEYKPANGAVTSTAYPLLIVRPDGIESYARARAAMAGWDDQFGYELVRDDLDLAFPEPKPGLDDKLVRAIDSARNRQAALLAAMPRKYGSRTRSLNGSTYAAGGQSQYSDGRQSQYADSAPYSGNQPSDGSGRGGFGGANTAFQGNAPAGLGGFGPDGRRATQYGQAQYGQTETTHAGGQAGFGGSGYGAESARQLDALEQSIASNSAGGFAFDPSDASHPLNQALGSNTLGHSGDRTSSSQAGGSNFPTSGGTGSGGPQNSSDGNATAGSTGQSSFGSPPMSSGQQIAIPDFGLGMASQSSGSASQPSGQPSDGNYSSRQSSAGGSSGSSGRSSRGAQSGSSRQTGYSQSGSSQPGPAQPIARSQGANWVTGGEQQRKLTPVRRTIRLICTEDAWTVVPSSRIEKEVVIRMEGTPEQRAEKLAEVIRTRMKSWGLALQGGYWRPELIVEVRPGAMWRYEQLERLFLASGIDIRAEESKPER